PMVSLDPPPPTALPTLSLHDALPICLRPSPPARSVAPPFSDADFSVAPPQCPRPVATFPPATSRAPSRAAARNGLPGIPGRPFRDRKSTRLNSSHGSISYAVFCLKKK